MAHNPMIQHFEFPADILGTVKEDTNFEETVNRVDAIEGVTVNRDRLFERWRMFAGTAATYQAFVEAEACDGMEILEYSAPVEAASPVE